MGLLVNIVTADEEDIEAVGAAQHPVDEWSGIELREIDTAKLATLHCLLTGDDFEEALGAYEPVYVGDEDGAVVLRIPDEVAAKLAGFDEEALERIGEELAATEEFEINGWPLEEVQGMVVQLGDLAQLAEAQGQIMLAWMHPLRT
jgi:hypothetical protein